MDFPNAMLPYHCVKVFLFTFGAHSLATHVNTVKLVECRWAHVIHLLVSSTAKKFK